MTPFVNLSQTNLKTSNKIRERVQDLTLLRLEKNVGFEVVTEYDCPSMSTEAFA